MSEIIITPKTERDTEFLLALLRGLDKVKNVKVRKRGKKNIDPITLASEASLAKDWDTPEDARYEKYLD